MEFASKLRWILVILAVGLFLTLVVWGLFSVARGLFTSSTENGQVTEVGYDVETAGTVRFITDGPVVANEEHRSYVIEVSSGVVSMKVYREYGSEIITQKSYSNTREAYDNFLAALKVSEVTDRQRGTDQEDDFAEEGVCAQGRRYIVELDSAERRWSTSCNNKQGTAGFNMSRVRALFQAQVPDYRDLVSGTGL